MDKSNAYAPLICHRCNTEAMPTVKKMYHSNGMHLTAYCSNCGSYIKHLPQGKTIEELPFGKYKGMAFQKVAEIDRKYLLWLSNQKLSDSLIRSIETALAISHDKNT